MSEFLAAAAQALNAPEFLVARSAQARASASGMSADEVLQAWAGGGAVAASAPAPAEAPADATPAGVPAEAPTEAPAEAPAPAPVGAPAAEAPATAPVPEPVPVAAAVAPEEEPVVAAPLSQRVRAATRVGSLVGGFGALLGWIFAIQYLAPLASRAGEAEAQVTAIEVMPGRLVLGAMLVSIPIGLAVAGLSRLLPSWRDPGMKLSGSSLPTAAVGILGGALVGALAGGIVAGGGTPLELPEGFSSIPLLGALAWGVLVWVAGGWGIAAVTQALGVPQGVPPEEAHEMVTVRARLASAIGIPLIAGLAILTLVLSFAFVFISFPAWAPLTGGVLAASILAFAGLSASKPNMRVGISELVVAAAGIGVVVLLIFAVLTATGAGSHAEEEAEEPEAAAIASVV